MSDHLQASMENGPAFCKKGLSDRNAPVACQVCRVMSKPIILRSATAADLRHLPAWFPSLSALIQWGGANLQHPLDQAQLDAMLAETLAAPPQRLMWGGFLPDGELAAHAQVVLDWPRQTARLARIAIAPHRRGSGLALPFLSQVMAALADATGIQTLELNVFTFNHSAIRLYEKLGFKPADLPPRAITVDGQVWDVARFVRPAPAGPDPVPIAPIDRPTD